ncbi:MAG: DUF4132 domain-containing protein [Myxococcales bacterium]|nr:DUF4132 domain-containing protein [Myxococcales bacterium]
MADEHLALIASIEADPDDINAFLVYGDYLQGLGDPRGELIAQHCRALAQGRDPAQDRRARDTLRAHREALLGPMAPPKMSRRVGVEWRLGFIDGATVRGHKGAEIGEALATLLGSPSARFMRALTIEEPKSPREKLDDDALFATLVASAPPTLSELRVGDPGKHPLPDALRAKLPRLARPAEERWAQVLAGIAGQKRLKVALSTRGLPKLVARRVPGADAAPELDVDPAQLLVGLKAEVDKKRHLGLIDALRELFTADSLDALAEALLGQWIRKKEPAGQRWAQQLAGLIGGDRTAATLGNNLEDWSHQRAVQGVRLLASIGSELAVSEIFGLVTLLQRTHSRRFDGAETLRALAKQRGCSVELMVDRAAPRELPQIGKGKQPTKATVALGERQRAIRRWRLEEMLADGTRLSRGDFLRHVAWNPIVGPLARRLVWGVFSGEQLVRAFRLDEDGAALDLADAPAPAAGAAETIGLPHPLELGPERVDRWRARFDALAIEQPFEQLARATYSIEPAERRQARLVKRFAKRSIRFDTIASALYKRGYYPYQDMEGDNYGFPMGYGRYYGRGVSATIDTWQYLAVEVEQRERLEPGERPTITFGELHPVTFSEIVRDAEILVEGNRYRPARTAQQPKRAAAPARGGGGGVTASSSGSGFPFAELAKSGRSTCIVCEQKIPKGELRVGVERDIETDTFTGKGTRWLHFGCRDKCEEFAGVEDDIALLRANSPGVEVPS